MKSETTSINTNGPLISISMLRLERKLAPIKSYDIPKDSMLASSIVEGKRKLDKLTQNELSSILDSNSAPPPAIKNQEGQFKISQRVSLPLPLNLSHRFLDNHHLWLGVEEGIAIVLNPQEHDLFLKLRDGIPPINIIRQFDLASPIKKRWTRLNDLIARLAVGGFIRGIEGYTDRWEAKPRRFMRIHITQRCNLTCVHCYADSSPFVSNEGEMPVERWLKLIDEFAAVGGERILFTGGEALIYPGIEKLLKRSREHDLDVTLFSNGLLVDRYLDVIKECVDQVQISIDGPDPETNDPIRGHGAFKKAKQAVDTLVNSGVRVRISMVVMEKNLEAMRTGFIPFATQWPREAVEWRLGYGVAHHGRGDEIGDNLGIDEVRPIVDDLLEQIEGDGGPRIARSTKGCGYAEQIVVAPDGSVHPCHLLDGAVTHINDQSMEELIGLLSKTSKDYDIDHTVGCNRCDIRNLCGGSCRIQNAKATGNRRVTNCTALDKLHRLHNLVQTFSESPIPVALEPDWE